MIINKIALLSFALLACIGPTTAFAHDKAGDTCDSEGHYAPDPATTDLLICANHVFQPEADLAHISIRVRLLDEHSHLLQEFDLVGRDGTPTPANLLKERTYATDAVTPKDPKGHAATSLVPYTVFEGFSAVITPRLMPTGDILLDYNIM